MDMRYTINKLLQIQVGVNLIRCLEGSSSFDEVVVAPMSGSCVGSLHSMHENEGAH